MTDCYRPLVQAGRMRPEDAVPLAGGTLWFTHAERLRRGRASRIVEAAQIPTQKLDRLTSARAPICGLAMNRPQIMGILNVTPDSFSDGGALADLEDALGAARAMIRTGAALIDIGGESTRPGAKPVPEDEEIRRAVPVIAALGAATAVPISVDTRKAGVARSAVEAGARLVNDVSGFTHDAALAPFCAEAGVAVCAMHAQGDPATMQEDPRYDDVLLDVYDFLDGRIDELVASGVARDRIVIDPGIGFGKTLAHNLELLRNLSVFHGLGCPVLLGASRKGFIGTIAGEPRADQRAPGSIAVGLAALAQGVQLLRVHDVAQTLQAVRLWMAVTQEERDA